MTDELTNPPVEESSQTPAPAEPSKDKLTKPRSSLIVTDTKEFGKAILAEAQEREKKARQDKVIAEVQRLETSRMEYIRKAEFATEAAAWYAKKLEAIKNGEFEFDLVHCEMKFLDPDLEDANF